VPLTYHSLSWALLFPTDAYSNRELISLLVVIPVLLLVGFATFGWTSLDRLLAGEKKPSPEPAVEHAAQSLKGGVSVQ
jgi:hypothetical protein